MPKTRMISALLILLGLYMATSARADVRIKDIADVEGVRQNQLVGYGLVVGLNGTGDKLNNNVFTRESLIGMLERLGVNTRDQVTALSTKTSPPSWSPPNCPHLPAAAAGLTSRSPPSATPPT